MRKSLAAPAAWLIACGSLTAASSSSGPTLAAPPPIPQSDSVPPKVPVPPPRKVAPTGPPGKPASTQSPVPAAGSSPVVGSGEAADRFNPVIQKLVTAINADDQAAIQKLYAPVMRQSMPRDQAARFFSGILALSGKITRTGKVNADGSVARTLLFGPHGAWRLQIVLDKRDAISGLSMVFVDSPPPDIPVPDRNTIPMRLPFRGAWFVVSGGSTIEQNHHLMEQNQRRAVDFLMRDAEGKSSYRGDGARNEDYLAFGQRILAPAAGEVVTVIDGVPDNRPGSSNPYSTVGNCVILRLAEHEFSVLAHLKRESTRVKVGDDVEAGQLLGECGNSGQSTEPHLHFHLQNTGVLQDGTGFAPYFQNVDLIREGKASAVSDYTPVQGDTVEQE